MDLGLIQRQVAERLGSNKTTIWNWENDWALPELRFMPAILAFLGYDPRPKAATTGKQLVRFREGRGWTRNRLAAELKVDPSTLARWEREERLPWGPYVERVTRCLEG